MTRIVEDKEKEVIWTTRLKYKWVDWTKCHSVKNVITHNLMQKDGAAKKMVCLWFIIVRKTGGNGSGFRDGLDEYKYKLENSQMLSRLGKQLQ